MLHLQIFFFNLFMRGQTWLINLNNFRLNLKTGLLIIIIIIKKGVISIWKIFITRYCFLWSLAPTCYWMLAINIWLYMTQINVSLPKCCIHNNAKENFAYSKCYYSIIFSIPKNKDDQFDYCRCHCTRINALSMMDLCICRTSVVPILMCFSLSTVFGCGLVFVCGVLYGIMTVGKK